MLCWTAHIQPEEKLGLASTTSWQSVLKQMFSCRKMHCGSGLGSSTMHSQGCSDNCAGLIKLPEWPHFKALQRPDKNHTAWPRALKGKGKGGKRTFRKCALLSPVRAVAQHLRGLAERRAPPPLGSNRETRTGRTCGHAALGPYSRAQSRLPLPASPAVLLPSCLPALHFCSASRPFQGPRAQKDPPTQSWGHLCCKYCHLLACSLHPLITHMA